MIIKYLQHGSVLTHSVLHEDMMLPLNNTALLITITYRDGQIDEAVNFAREVLSPMRGLFAHRSPNYDAMLADVVALLAYINPQVRGKDRN